MWRCSRPSESAAALAEYDATVAAATVPRLRRPRDVKGLGGSNFPTCLPGRFIITPTLTIFFPLSVDISYSKFLSCDRLELILVEYFVITVLAG